MSKDLLLMSILALFLPFDLSKSQNNLQILLVGRLCNTKAYQNSSSTGKSCDSSIHPKAFPLQNEADMGSFSLCVQFYLIEHPNTDFQASFGMVFQT